MGRISEEEAIKEGCNGPVIRWDNYGYEGWKPRSYATVREALEDWRYGNEFVLTKIAQFHVVEEETPQR